MSAIRAMMTGMTREPWDPSTERPTLVLLRPPITAEKLALMYERLTGRQMTPEEIEAAKARLGGK
jgi:hypothetical protein